MATASRGRTLWHDTTKKRAEAIVQRGPDQGFVEPGSCEKAGGFSTAPNEGPYPYGDPKAYASRKAILFADEGGPAIVEVEVPAEIVALAIDVVAEIRFEPGAWVLKNWARCGRRFPRGSWSYDVKTIANRLNTADGRRYPADSTARS